MSKLCAEGAIKNLLSMLNDSQSNIDSFWNLCNAPVSELMEQFHEKFMPKAVLNVHCTVNPIKTCLWILQLKFRFTTTSKLGSSCLTSVKRSVSYLSRLKFPAIILVNSKLGVMSMLLLFGVTWSLTMNRNIFINSLRTR